MSRVAGAASCLSSGNTAAAGYRSCSPYIVIGSPVVGRPVSCCMHPSQRWAIRRSLSCPTWASAIRSASQAIASTIGWKLPLLIMAWSDTETSGLSSAELSSTVTAFRAAATYSRSAPCTWGTTRNERASCTDLGPPG